MMLMNQKEGGITVFRRKRKSNQGVLEMYTGEVLQAVYHESEHIDNSNIQ